VWHVSFADSDDRIGFEPALAAALELVALLENEAGV
jgi:hypothetical protein